MWCGGVVRVYARISEGNVCVLRLCVCVGCVYVCGVGIVGCYLAEVLGPGGEMHFCVFYSQTVEGTTVNVFYSRVQ